MRFSFTPEAERDMDQISAYLNELPQAPALRIGRAIQRAIANICQFPGLGRTDEKVTKLVRADVRRFTTRKYILFYTVSERSIRILGVLDGRRDVEEMMSWRRS